MRKNVLMWLTFGPDLLAAIIASVIGAILTVAIAAGTYFLQLSRRETSELRFLVGELSTRRAIVPNRDPTRVAGAEKLPDYERANLSVLHIRDGVRDVLRAIQPQSKAQPTLETMLGACNEYLETSASDPPNYVHDLVALRAHLAAAVTDLCKVNSKIAYLEPGSKAFTTR